MTRADRIARLYQEADRRILVIDGAMGTMIQRYKLELEDYAGERFANWPVDVKGNNDLLSITRPEIIREIHSQYLAAGADILETNTFSSTTIAQADYQMQSLAYEMNVAGARVAREAADAWEAAHPGSVKWVAGAVGPTNRTASISPDVNDPGYRNTSFDELRTAYAEATRGLIEGGADIILVETIFDTLNAKAALYAIEEVFEELDIKLPIMVSGTITDLSGRTLSGQTPEAFWNSVRHVQPFSVGFNCALGAEQMRPFLAELARVADTRISVYPNAGLPNAFGGYDETPHQTGHHLHEWAHDGLVNIVGGCCGTTPDHIHAIADGVKSESARTVPARPRGLRLSGLEPFELV